MMPVTAGSPATGPSQTEAMAAPMTASTRYCRRKASRALVEASRKTTAKATGSTAQAGCSGNRRCQPVRRPES